MAPMRIMICLTYARTQDGNGDGLILRNVEFWRSGRDCIDLLGCSGFGPSSDILIEDSTIHHCIAAGDAHGITGDSVYNVTIRNTEIFLVSGDAVQFSPSRCDWDDVFIQECIFHAGLLDEATPTRPSGEYVGENAIDTKTPPVPAAEIHLYVDGLEAYGWLVTPTSGGAALNLKELAKADVRRVVIHDGFWGFRLRHPASIFVANSLLYNLEVAIRLEDGIINPNLVFVTVGTGVVAVAKLMLELIQ
eukprot:TRINITY_DN16134_c0_g1_i1.p1 TRINITY_DN16134_c0_g1~~TRINITY_DN16134_c0_g1_i1.p1  ORF type:complete len:248 (+),score=23.68 TRINITY_DN16134_c0_g1_i1:341-1084(+)